MTPQVFAQATASAVGSEGKNKCLMLNMALTHPGGSGKQAAEEKDLEFKDRGWTELKSLDSSAGRW